MNILNTVTESINQFSQKVRDIVQVTLNNILSNIKPLDFASLKRSSDKVNVIDKYVHTIKNLCSIAQSIGSPIKYTNQSVYLYNGRYWSLVPKDTCEHFLGAVAEASGFDYSKANYYCTKSKLFKQLQAEAYCEPEKQDTLTTFINLNNYTLRVSTNGIEMNPHSADDNLHYCLEFDYNPSAACPIFDKFLDEVLPDKEAQRLLLEYMGYIFIKGLKLEKVLVLLGKGANGKSVLFDVITALVGKHNTTNFKVGDLTYDRNYCRIKIENKLLNYDTDLKNSINAADFKILASNEPISARDIYKEPQMIYNYAKLIFNTNELPDNGAESSDGYLRRFLILTFEVTIEESKRDVNLSKKIIASELAGVLNRALEGAQRVIAQKGFSYCLASNQAIREYQEEISPVKEFIRVKQYRASDEHRITLRNLYSEFQIFYEDFSEIGFKQFSKELKKDFVVRCVGGKARSVFIEHFD
ncbi:MAG: phage/plasmid primase, P4 family [Mucinivorans sp.]